MHKIIRLIIHAKDKNEALDTAEVLLWQMQERKVEGMDSYALFDDDWATNRWGKLVPVPVVSIKSKAGKKLIDEGLKFTKEEFMRSLSYVKKMLKYYTDEEVYERETKDNAKKIADSFNDDTLSNIFFFKYYCRKLAGEDGGFVFDKHGEIVRSKQELKWALEKEDKKLKTWVIPVDIHY